MDTEPAAPASDDDPPGSAARPSSPTTRRTRGLVVIVLVAVVAAAAGLLGSRWIKSPAQLAADSSAPPPSVITAPVESRVVSSGMVTRGTVGSLSTVNAVPAIRPAGVAAALITRLPAKAGDKLRPGDVVLEVSGRPVFYLPGPIPPYRDLAPGATGPDVRQLQRALRQAGYADADPAGHYGSETTAAVVALYQEHGYAPQGGGVLPMSAVDYVDSPTSTVVTLDASLGEDASKAVVQLASGDLVVLVDQPPAASDLMTVGAAVQLTAELLDQTATGTITRIVPGEAGAHPEAVVTPDKTLGAGWAGQDVRVTITQGSSTGKVLAVPVSAVSLGGDGRAKVVVVRDGRQTDVPVVVGATGGGYAQITPSGESRVSEGDQVIVGAQ